MKLRLMIAGIILAATTLACSLTSGGSQVPTQAVNATMPVLIETQPAATLVPTVEIPAPTEPVATPTTPPTTEPQSSTIILLADPFNTPAQGHILNAATGDVLQSFEAPGLKQQYQVYASDQSLFYRNEDSNEYLSAGSDGSTHDLGFMNTGTGYFDAVLLPSPDGSQVAWGWAGDYDPNGAVNVTLNTAGVDGSNLKTLLSEKRTLPSRPQPWRWSIDGQSLYFSNIPYGIGGYILFGGGPDLLKINLTSGEITSVLPDKRCLCPTTLSPDESQVAYVESADPAMILHIVDTSTGNDRTINLPFGYSQAGGIAWAPDGKSLALTLAIGNPDAEAYSIVRVDTQALTLRVLLPNDTRLIQTVLWPEATTLWVQDNTPNVYRMNPETGELTLAGEKQIIARPSW